MMKLGSPVLISKSHRDYRCYILIDGDVLKFKGFKGVHLVKYKEVPCDSSLKWLNMWVRFYLDLFCGIY